MLYIYTDACVVKDESTHAYLLFDQEKNFIEGDVFYRKCKTSVEAEVLSIAKALHQAKTYNPSKIIVHADYLSPKLLEDAKVKEVVAQFTVQFKWIPRERNKFTDMMCREGVSFLRRMTNLIDLEIKTSDFERPEALYLNNINELSLTAKQKTEMQHLLTNLSKERDTDLREILNWSKNKLTRNTAIGRRYLVKQFLFYKYSLSNQAKQPMLILANQKTIIREFESFTITKSVYKSYKKLTRKNKQIDKEDARKKLFRNMKLANKCIEQNGVKSYIYGSLKMDMVGNRMVRLEMLNRSLYGFRVSDHAYEEFNSLLKIGK